MKTIIAAGITALTLGLAAQPALAADMPVKAPRIVADPWSWGGFYIGGNGGYSWGRSRTSVEYFSTATGLPIAPPAGSITSASFDLDGWVAGGQLGFNFQNNNWVYGFEADFQWTGQDGDANFLCAAVAPAGGVCLPGSTFIPAGVTGTTLALSQKLEWFATLRGRVGMLVQPTMLAYVTGGLAIGSLKSTSTLGSSTPAGVLVAAQSSNRDRNAGWVVGAGLEARLSGNWTGKVEYLYMDLGTFNTSVAFATTPAIGARIRSDVTDNILRVGLNYKWGSAPVVARY